MATEADAVVQDSNFFLKHLAVKLQGKPPEVQQRVNAHIRAKTGHNTLVAFHNNGSSEDEKVELYKELIFAVIKNDWSKLQGQVPSGQASERTPRIRYTVILDSPAKPEPPKPKPEPEPEPKKPEPEPAPQPQPQAGDPRMAAVMAAIAAAFSTPQGPQIDEAKVRSLVTDAVNERMKEIRSGVMSEFDSIADKADKRVRDYLAKVPPREVIEIRKWDGSVTEIKERTHKQFGTLVKLLSSRNAQGWTEFIYIWGAPGAGKTYLAKQLAQALGVKCYPFPCGPTATEGKMLGFNNIANGTFIAGWLHEGFKNGGLVALDEIDLADGSVMAANNSIENETFTFGNGEVVNRHKDFYLIAFANTQGTGTTGGFTRNRLDAATLNRFTQFKLEYDHDLEREIFGNKDWADYVIRVREYVQKNAKDSIYITPRATRKGAAYLANGIPPEQVADMVLFGMCSKEIKNTILQNVGPFNP